MNVYINMATKVANSLAYGASLEYVLEYLLDQGASPVLAMNIVRLANWMNTSGELSFMGTRGFSTGRSGTRYRSGRQSGA